MRTLIVAALMAVGLAAQEPRLVSLGLGRSRLELVLEEREALRPDEDARVEIGRLSFRDRWFQRELPHLVPALEAVDVLERVTARKSLTGLAATRDRVLEIVGPDEAVRGAEVVLRRMLASDDLVIRARAWVVLLGEPAAGGSAPRLQLLGEAALARRMEEVASSEVAQIVETADIEFQNGRETTIAVGNRVAYVRDHRVSSTGDHLFTEPIMDSFQEGLSWQMGAIREPETDRLHVDVGFILAQAEKPLARLEGKVGREGERLMIEKPIIAETRWVSERMVLGAAHQGFRVTGIRLLEPGREEGRPPRQIEIICQIDRLRSEPIADGGLVQGFDQGEGLAFVRIESGDRMVGDVVVFERAGRKVGEGRVDEVVGALITVAVIDGEPRSGDRAR